MQALWCREELRFLILVFLSSIALTAACGPVAPAMQPATVGASPPTASVVDEPAPPAATGLQALPPGAMAYVSVRPELYDHLLAIQHKKACPGKSDYFKVR